MNPLKLALMAALLLPVAEIYVLIYLGGLLGFLPTVALLSIAALTGSYLLQTQGLRTWSRIQQSLAAGRPPAQDLIEGGLMLGAGILLLIPGFVSDGLAIFLLIPTLRQRLAAYIVGRLIAESGAGTPPDSSPQTLEGQFRRED